MPHRKIGAKESRRYLQPPPPPRRFVAPTPGETREARSHRVADFNTLDDLIAHAGRELGATHVSGSEANTKIFFPRGGTHPYEEASVWRKGGYWHAQGPGARAGVSTLPRDARPISGHVERRAAETSERLYHIVAINERTGKKTYMTSTPEPHHEATVILSKMVRRTKGAGKHVRYQLESVGEAPRRHSMTETSRGSPAYKEALDDAVASWNRGDSYRDGTLRFLVNMGLVENVGKGWRPTAEGKQAGLRTDHLDESRENADHRRTARGAESRGEQYAIDQLQSDHFNDWIRDQLLEASRVPPEDTIPLETKADAQKIARRMLQQLGWDARRDLSEDDAFWAGFDRALSKSRDWLADELLEIKSETGGGHVREVRAASGAPLEDYSDVRAQGRRPR